MQYDNLLHHLTGQRVGETRQFTWPLQEIAFQSVIGTPRRLSVFETILLHIYITMKADVPDCSAISRELAIGDSFFVSETLADLIRLGAVETGPADKPQITDPGWEYYRRGQIPSQRRERMFSIIFDPIAGDFPDEPIELNDEETTDEETLLQPITTDFQLADPNRIDLETIREVSIRQGSLDHENDTVIFTAAYCSGRVHWQPISLTVLSNYDNEVEFRIDDPRESNRRGWFQRVIDNHKTGGILT